LLFIRFIPMIAIFEVRDLVHKTTAHTAEHEDSGHAGA
jgi:hypothetical protein